MRSPVDWALVYLRLGWSVIPGGSNKRPLIKWKEYQSRIPSVDEVRLWYRQFPMAGVIIITGRVSGFVVLDVDPRHGGDKSLAQMLENGQLKGIDDAPRVRTPSGGVHYYFYIPKNLMSGERVIGLKHGFMPGLDLQGESGYVVAPPTVRSDGRYVWESLPPEILLMEEDAAGQKVEIP